MTKVIDGTKVLTFDEWRKLPAVKDMQENSPDCEFCDGTGEHECDCGDVHDCAACDGAGKERNLRDIYDELLRYETQILLNWKNGLPLQRLMNIAVIGSERIPIDHVPLRLFIHK